MSPGVGALEAKDYRLYPLLHSYKHNWRYHKELRLWLTKEAGTEPTQKTSSYERGSYMCVLLPFALPFYP